MKISGHKTGFTVIEMLFASALSVMAVAMVLLLLVKNIEVWREGMARIWLSGQSRIVRERILHGINGQYGLRHALRSQLVFADDEILFTDVASTNPIILVLSINKPPAWLDHTGTNFIVRGGVFVDDVALSRNGNVLNIDLTLALVSHGEKYSQPQQIRVYLLNDNKEPGVEDSL